ncbi:zf-HC2 domain-containing protein [Ponticaulis sp.]|uniref:anti-sigma factor n=1 Tax=Ponticaulis sp. TaxID=2020902 RepID=UPI000B67DAA7|nr:zf-HC2 domain-containing protein [Ponticaulis sp.]MAI90622.1 hypothetical protein [Ponticaulis sp.]OUX99135.1 MAG: hypothetical protein CBB65_09295 [Hyphomonadaceae bacterium TMED5]|tara:strand:- start:81338 stop:82135 length:798 start_codon:yes stop_codon:yes gene_type:complete
MTDMTHDIDARLSAYLDDELSEADRQKVEALLINDPEIAERLEALALADSDFADYAGQIDEMPMSEGLSGTLDRLKSGAAVEPESAEIISFPLWKRGLRFVDEHRAIAAGLVVAAMTATALPILTAHDVAPERYNSGSMVLASSDLGEVLRTTASGETHSDSGAEYAPQFSFISASGEPCRVVDLTSASEAARLIACQRADHWQVEQAAYSEPAQGVQNTFQTASGPGSEAIEHALDELMAAAPLSLAEEEQLIEAGWQHETEDN